MDLMCAVIRLRAVRGADNLKHSGHFARAWLLEQVEALDPDMYGRIHPGQDTPPSAGNEPETGSAQSSNESVEGRVYRPYTISTFYCGSSRPQTVLPGDRCWLRVTTLTGELTHLMHTQLLPSLEEIRLGNVEFSVEGCTVDPQEHPWAGQSSYAALMHWAQQCQETSFQFEYFSPTYFTSKDLDLPLPIPALVFKSYWEHWLALTRITGEAEFGTFLEEHLAINKYEIDSERVAFPNNRPPGAWAFCGQARFSVVSTRKKLKRWPRAVREHYQNIIRMLAAFSFFCGTGYRTTIGMGQTRLVWPEVKFSLDGLHH